MATEILWGYMGIISFSNLFPILNSPSFDTVVDVGDDKSTFSIGERDNLQEQPSSLEENMVSCRSSLQPIQWILIYNIMVYIYMHILDYIGISMVTQQNIPSNTAPHD